MTDGLARSTRAELKDAPLFSKAAPAKRVGTGLVDSREADSVLFRLEDLTRTESTDPPPPPRLAIRPANDRGSGLIDLSELVGNNLAPDAEPEQQSGEGFATTGSLMAEILAARAEPPAAPYAPAKPSIIPTLLMMSGAAVVLFAVAVIALKVL